MRTIATDTSRGLSVCLLVSSVSWTDRDAVCGSNSCGSKEPLCWASWRRHLANTIEDPCWAAMRAVATITVTRVTCFLIRQLLSSHFLVSIHSWHLVMIDREVKQVSRWFSCVMAPKLQKLRCRRRHAEWCSTLHEERFLRCQLLDYSVL